MMNEKKKELVFFQRIFFSKRMWVFSWLLEVFFLFLILFGKSFLSRKSKYFWFDLFSLIIFGCFRSWTLFTQRSGTPSTASDFCVSRVSLEYTLMRMNTKFCWNPLESDKITKKLSNGIFLLTTECLNTTLRIKKFFPGNLCCFLIKKFKNNIKNFLEKWTENYIFGNF